MTLGRACLLVMIAGCAHGGADTGDGGIDSSPGHHDAHPQTVTDSSVAHDAPVSQLDAPITIDAALAPDASTSGNLCTANAQCTDAGQCCLSINGIGVCSNGTIVGSTCLPI